MSRNLFHDLYPFKTDRLSLDARIRRLVRDLNSVFVAHFLPNSDKRGGFRLETADGLNSMGTQGGNDFGVYSAQTSIVSGAQLFFKTNNVWDGVNDKFVTAAPASQFFFGVSYPSPQFRTNANSPVAGGNIVWGPHRSLLPVTVTNANGTSTRFADGTQICTFTTPATASEETWIYPQSFTTTPNIQATINADGGTVDLICMVRFSSNTSATVRKRYWDGSQWQSAVTEPVFLMAIGRWY